MPSPVPSLELTKPEWSRLERRASTLLLMAVPEGQREELISAKRLSAMAIICQLLVTYQPGGLAEKELILRSLELPPESTLVEAVQSLRRWSRWRRRAADLLPPFEGTQPDHQEASGSQSRFELPHQPSTFHSSSGLNTNISIGEFL